MSKSFYLKFGYLHNNRKELVDIISKKINIILQPTSNGNYGYRFGEVAETISIFNNYIEYEDWWQEENFKNCPTIITASFTKGKNVEKEKKMNYLKNVLLTIPDLIEIDLQVLESEN